MRATWRPFPEFIGEAKFFEKPTIARQSWVFHFLTPRPNIEHPSPPLTTHSMKLNSTPQNRLDRDQNHRVGNFARNAETDLENLKTRLLRDTLRGTVTPGLIPQLRRAANEAAALAWLEPYPLLAFPTLFQEKALEAQRHFHRQGIIRSRSAELLAFAA